MARTDDQAALISGTAQTLPGLTGRVNAQVAVSVGVDWFQATGDCGRLWDVADLCCAWWGQPREGQGGQFFTHSMHWPCGAALYFTPPGEASAIKHPGRFMLQLSGSVLAQWDGDERVAALREFHAAGATDVTRLDVAVDFRGVAVELVECAIRACEAGELRRFKLWDVRRPVSAGRVVGLSVTCGRRGKYGGGREVCIYDKGLEQRSGAANQWQRLESRFYAAFAGGAWAAIAEPGENGANRMLAVGLGAIDFRRARADGKRPRRVEDLKRPPWWSDVVGIVVQTERIRVPRRERHNFRRWAKWVARCVVPSMRAMANLTNKQLADVWERVMEHAGSSGDAFRAHVWEFVEEERRRAKARAG